MPTLVMLGAWLCVGAFTFAQALSAVDSTPALRAAHEARDARSERASEVSSLTYNPTLQLQSGARVDSAGRVLPEIYLTANQRFNAAGLSDARRQALERELDGDAALIDVLRRDAREQVARAWLARWAGQATLAKTQEEIALIDALIVGAEATRLAGEATRVDVDLLRAFRAEAELSALRAEGEAFDAGLALTRAMGATEARPSATEGDLPAFTAPSIAWLQQRASDVRDQPDVAAAQADQAMARAHLTETGAARGSTYAVGAMAFREGGGDYALLGTLDLDLPIFESGQRERATAASEVAHADGRAHQATVDARVNNARAVHELQHAEQVARVTEEQLLATALSLADAQHTRWLAREATAQEWINARRNVLVAKVALVRAQAELTLARFVVSERFGSSTPNSTRNATRAQP